MLRFIILVAFSSTVLPLSAMADETGSPRRALVSQSRQTAEISVGAGGMIETRRERFSGGRQVAQTACGPSGFVCPQNYRCCVRPLNQYYCTPEGHGC